MAEFEKNIETCAGCVLYWLCYNLDGLPPCALVAQNSTSTNKSSPKLHRFEEILSGCQPPFGKQSSRNYISGMRYMYNFIVGEIGR